MDPQVTGETPGHFVVIDPGGGVPEPTTVVVYDLSRLTPVLCSFVAVGCGAGTIAGGKQTGTIRTLQSLPVSRSNVVVGTLLIRLASAMVVVLSGLVTGAVVAGFRFGTIEAGSYATFVLATLLFVTVLTTLAVSVSAVVSTRLRAIAFSLGPFLIASVVGTDRDVPLPVRSASPVQPYQLLVTRSHDQLLAVPRIEYAIETGRIGSTANPRALGTEILVAEAPTYLTDPGAVIILACWIVLVPISISRYRREDL
nr:ABC transporter permease subunit [Halovivax gelatinilyticus]